VQALDKRAFMIALEKDDISLVSAGNFLELLLDVDKRALAVNGRFARPEEIQVGAVEDENAV
jgi:hypothetical protein